MNELRWFSSIVLFIATFFLFSLLVASHVQAACTSPAGSAGHIVYNKDHKVVQYCNGTDWIGIHQKATGTGGCTNPAKPEGTLFYNVDHRVLQACAGNQWKAMGPLQSGASGNCSSPVRPAGTMLYNIDHSVMQYCDGQVWRLLGHLAASDPGVCTQDDLFRDGMELDLSDSMKWYNGVLANDGKVYGIPHWSPDILIIDPSSGTASRTNMGVAMSETEKWFGGVLASNGKIYGIPNSATDILIIDPEAGTASRSNMGADLSGGSKWLGGVLASDGKIYGIPSWATDILIIDPEAGTASRSNMGATLTGSQKWVGGVLGPDGKIYGIPNSATDILIIDPVAGTASRSNMGADLSGTAKWLGGVLGADGKIYGMPYNSTDILIIDPIAGTASRSNMGLDLSDIAKWGGGVEGADGKIYGIPHYSEDLLIIDPGTGSASRNNMGVDLSGTSKWFGGVLVSSKIYGIPHTASDVLVMDVRNCSTPAAFTFPDQSSVLTNTSIESAIIEITGILNNLTPSVSISGQGSPAFRICSNSDCSGVVSDWSPSTRTIESNQYLQLRLTSSENHSETFTATLTIDTISDDWAVTTAAPPKRLFVSSANYKGNIGSIETADSNCQSLAEGATLGGTWKAWISNSTTNAADRITDNLYGWRLLDGTQVVNNKADLTDGTIGAPINRNENNLSLGTVEVWTGTLATGVRSSSTGTDHCNDWSHGGGGSPSAHYGSSGATNGSWTDTGAGGACGTSRHLYCFEQ